VPLSIALIQLLAGRKWGG